MARDRFITEPIEACEYCALNPQECIGCDLYIEERAEFIRKKLEEAESLKKEHDWLKIYCRHGEEGVTGSNWVKRVKKGTGYECSRCHRFFATQIAVNRAVLERLPITNQATSTTLEGIPNPPKFVPKK